MGRAPSLLFALAAAWSMGGCGRGSATQTVKQISVFAPLSGAEATRGEAVLRMSNIINQKLAAGSTVALDVHDSNLAPEKLETQIAAWRAEPVLVVAGCDETSAAFAAFGTTGPLIVTLFCDSLELRERIERVDRDAKKYFWIGPSLVTLLRVADMYLRSTEESAQEFGYGVLGGTVVLTKQNNLPRLNATIDDIRARGIDLKVLELETSDNVKITDYAREIAALPESERAANGVGLSKNFVLLLMPWLSSMEWVRQAQLGLPTAAWAKLREMLLMPADYLAQDAVRLAFPFRLDRVGSLALLGSVNPDPVALLEADAKREFGSGGLSMVSRLVADALATIALTAAVEPGGSADAFRERWLGVVGAAPPSSGAARKVSYATFADGLAALQRKETIDYDGVYSLMNDFDAFGQLSGDLQGILKRFATSDSGTGNILAKRPFPRDPIEGFPLSARAAADKGCITLDKPEGAAYALQPARTLFDRNHATGAVTFNAAHKSMTINLHFTTPVELTGVSWDHARLSFIRDAGSIDNALFWWKDALPLGFSPKSPPLAPSGAVNLGTSEMGEYVGVDWSFDAEAVQSLSIVATPHELYDDQPIFNDMYLFLTEASYRTFCRDR